MRPLVVKPTTIQVVITVALARDWMLMQQHINKAFLNEDLQEVYVNYGHPISHHLYSHPLLLHHSALPFSLRTLQSK